MFRSDEMNFFRHVCKRCGINVAVFPLKDNEEKPLSDFLESIYSFLSSMNRPVKDVIGTPERQVMYKLTDAFQLRCIFFLIQDGMQESIFFLGPYTNVPITPEMVTEYAAHSTANRSFVESCCASIPVLPETSHLLIMLDALCERMWDNSVFPVVDISDQSGDQLQMLEQELGEQDNTLIRMKLMENRYHYENELMQAVSLGQIQKFDQLISSFTEISFEQRTADPVRNMKNYCIIMNTLLRKAAENGGVHPFYIDRVSSSFAFRIEQLSSVADTADIMSDIFSSYCRLVRKHSLKNYSPVVQKTVIYIEADLSANLSLSVLANAQNVSPGYLSTVFRRETGMTVTQFVHQKRMNHAMNLLRTTQMQIQTVALHCGIADLQYFSKLFKKHSGKSPKEYREAN